MRYFFWSALDGALGWATLAGIACLAYGLIWALASTHWLATILVIFGAVMLLIYFRYGLALHYKHVTVSELRDEAKKRR